MGSWNLACSILMGGFKKVVQDFLKFLFFGQIWHPKVSNFAKMAKMAAFGCHFGSKYQNFKKSRTIFIKPPLRMLHAKVQLPKYYRYQKQLIFMWKLDIFFVYFPYISYILLLCFRHTYLYGFAHKMTTAHNWKVIEPILETRNIT